jgi:TRAP-type mannitol/chloroaromatic compound transport system permease small subunit
MKFLLPLSRAIDWLNGRIGRAVPWLLLAAVFLSAGNAIVRKLVHVGSNALLEAQWYLFSAVFLLCAGYVLLKNAHVRIDMVSGRLSARSRAYIDVAGILFFMTPLCLLLIYLSWPMFLEAWRSGEISHNYGGLVRWPVYLLLPAGMALLLLQGVSELIKRIAFLLGAAR